MIPGSRVGMAISRREIMAPMKMMISSNKQQQVRNYNSFSDDKFQSCSKAQMCLKKIIDIIISSSGCYSSSSSTSSSLKPICEKIELKSEKSSGTRDLISTGKKIRGGIDIDLNLRLGPSLEESAEVMNKGFSACSGVGEAGNKVCGLIVVGDGADCNSSSSAVSGGFSVALDKSSEGECDDSKQVENSINEVSRGNQTRKQVVIEEETREFSEITNLNVRSSFEAEVAGEAEEEEKENEVVVEEEGEKIQMKEYKNEGYLGLLVEAARLISGDFKETEQEKKRKSGVESDERNESIRNGSKRNQSWMLDLYGGFEDISPVVRSKRGRNQVLPYRYRDSVLDPWKPLSRQRSSKDHHSTKNKN